MQTCYNCGRQVDDNVLICPECGALVRRYGKPEPPRPEMAEAPDCAPQPAARAARSKRLPAGAKIWLILCIVVNAIQVFGFVNLFYLYGNQSLFSDVFAAYPELAPMQELLGTLMQSVSMFFWFYVLEASLLLLKCAGLIWFAASARRTAFFAALSFHVLLALLTFVTAGLLQALLSLAGPAILYLLLRKQWSMLAK